MKNSRFIILGTLLALASSSLLGQEVKMPQSVTVAPYRLAAIEMTYDGDDFAYSVAPELDAFREYTTDPKVVRLRVQFVPRPDGPQSGTFLISAVSTKLVDGKAKLSPFQTCLVSISGTSPVKPPPVDPQPGPQPGPIPAPLAGMRVLVIYESSIPIPPPVYDAIMSPVVQEYLRLKCLMGPDGKTPESRRFDDDTSLAALGKAWVDLRAKLPADLPLGPNGYPIPQVAIGDSSGAVVFSGPLPENETKTLELFKKYGGQ